MSHRVLSCLVVLLCLVISESRAQLTPNYVADGNSPNAGFGSSTGHAGDFNNDGVDDFIIGAPAFNAERGQVRVYSGADGSLLFIRAGISLGDRFGHAVSGAGDVNGDGFDDILIGIPGSDVGGTNVGRAQVFSGADSTILYSFDGAVQGARFGTSVCSLGDLTSDGRSEFAISAPNDNAAVFNEGRVRVYSGANGNVIATFDGQHNADSFGITIVAAGDVNNDGLCDLAVGATGGIFTERVTIYSGDDGSVLHTILGPGNIFGSFGTKIAAAGDVDNDGHDDLILGDPFSSATENFSGFVQLYSGATGNLLITIHGQAVNERFGMAVSAAGDLNGDGFDDFAVGAPGSTTSTEPGLVRFYNGATGEHMITIEGDNNGDRFGSAVSLLGDNDGNGFGEILIGAPFSDSGGLDAGETTVFQGALVTLAPVSTYTSALPTLDLSLSWTPDGGDVNAVTGTIVCDGATPGGFGIVGLSLASVNYPYFGLGFPLLIAIDPINFIGQVPFGYGFGGELVVANASRQNPFIAGSRVHIQVFETFPVVRASNGLRMVIVP